MRFGRLLGVLAAIVGLLAPGAASAAPALLNLTAADADRIAAQAEVACSVISACNNRFTVAVVDRVGNVLAVYRRGPASKTTLQSGLKVSGGLEGIFNDPTITFPSLPADANQGVPLDLAALAAISKAVTGAYLSSSGNAFSTRTASFIVQNHFVPGVRNSPGGPLFGVQFSQLPCGDFVQTNDPGAGTGIGPRRSPLGLSADPGGFPLYKNGVVVGGVGVIAGDAATYTLDLNPRRPSADLEERIALGASRGFTAPTAIRADRITAGGISLPYSASDGVVPNTSAAGSVPTVATALLSVPGWFTSGAVKNGTAYGDPASGYVAATEADSSVAIAGRRAYILDSGAGTNRYRPVTSAVSPELTDERVAEILQQALGVANQARAQIRKPLNSPAEVTISVVDSAGNILGVARTPDAPIFGTDVSLQKARTAALFSRPDASSLISKNTGDSLLNSLFRNIPKIQDAGKYMDAAERFFGDDVFSSGFAITDRAIGNIARPNFPDGIDGRPPGPLSNPSSSWSPFNVGLQLDLVQFQLLLSLVNASDSADPVTGCASKSTMAFGALPSSLPGPSAADELADADAAKLFANGIQIFPGGVPIYAADGTLVGAVGVSGDGIDQDDMIASLGLARASKALKGVIRHADPSIRSDALGLRYVQCPQTPFTSSQAQNVCNF